MVTSQRRSLLEGLSSALAFVALVQHHPHAAHALSPTTTAVKSPAIIASNSASSVTASSANLPKLVAYKSLSITVGGGDDEEEEVGVQVPVACWFPVDNNNNNPSRSTTSKELTSEPTVRYQHRISVRKIGQLLAGWDFIPEFVSRDYALSPTLSSPNIVINGDNLSLPRRAPVVLLAHGYLGSRFDLSHLAEHLTLHLGCVCVAAEYPESLAASFETTTRSGSSSSSSNTGSRQPKRAAMVDRTRITNTLLTTLSKEWNVQGTSFGIVGHSLGCGTALETGDDTWSRVLIAGFPRLRDGRSLPGKNVLLVMSMNDGAVSLSRWGGTAAIPSDLERLGVDTDNNNNNMIMIGGGGANNRRLPRRASLVLEGETAPNHISFLAQNVNNAMLDLLSPLLPVAQALDIPVLDFDRYQASRDSLPTAQLLHPLVTEYLKQHMLQS